MKLLLHVSRCEMLHFVTSYMKQNVSRKQSLETAQNGLEIILKSSEASEKYTPFKSAVCFNCQGFTKMTMVHLLWPMIT